MNTLTVLKKISWPLLFMIIGFFIALFYLHQRNKQNQFVYGKIDGGKPSWTRLDDTIAKGVMKHYWDDQHRIWPHYFRLRTGNKEKVLRGFWLDKKMLDSIAYVADSLKHQVDGYHVYMGKWDTAGKRYYTLVVRGSAKSKSLSDTSGGVGPYFDMVDPCPDNCGEEGPGGKK